MIGVAPNCDRILEIFPPAFTTYNLIVPNMLNVPFLLWGVAAPADLVSLAMYYSSRSAQCAYCSLHTCSFALRRGVDEPALTGMRSFSKKETAVVELALNLMSVPNHVTDEDRRRLYDFLSPANVEWIVLAIGMMGFLSTFMNSMGIDMEQTTVDDVSGVMRKAGWSEGKHDVTPSEHKLQDAESRPLRGDTLFSNLSMLRYLPSALTYDNKATKKIPKAWPEIGDYLLTTVGHSFPILGLLNHSRAVRAIAEALRLNLDAIVCGIEPDVKYLIGIVFAGVNDNQLMGKEFRRMTMLMVDYLDEKTVNAVHEFAKEDTDFSIPFYEAMKESVLAGTPLPESQTRLLYIAKACSFAPVRTSQNVVDATKEIRAEHSVELVCWVSVLALLQKLYIFYYPSCTERMVLKGALLDERTPQFTKILPRID